MERPVQTADEVEEQTGEEPIKMVEQTEKPEPEKITGRDVYKRQYSYWVWLRIKNFIVYLWKIELLHYTIMWEYNIVLPCCYFIQHNNVITLVWWKFEKLNCIQLSVVVLICRMLHGVEYR